MASIPLPALSIKPPAQGPDPIEQYSRLQGIRDLMQRQQIQQQQLQQEQQLDPLRVQSAQADVTAAQQKNKLQQIDLENVQNAQKYWTDPSKFQGAAKTSTSGAGPGFAENALGIQSDDPLAQHINGMIQAGVNPTMGPNSALAMGKQLLDFRSNVLKQTADQQKVTTDGLATINKILTPIAAESDAGKRTAMLQEASPTLEQASRFDPSIHQAVMTADPNHLDKITTMTGALQDVVNYGKTQTEAASAAQLLGTNPAIADTRYRDIQAKIAQKQSVSADDKAFVTAYEKQKTLVGTSNFNLNQGGFANTPPMPPGATGQDALSQMDPKMAAMVKMVGDYKQKSSEITQRMPPYAKANFLSALNAAYPNYDENEFPARNKMLTSFTSGPESKSINAINTAMGHVGVLNDSIDALNNGDLKFLNSVANRFGIETGATPAAVFKTIVHRVGPELAAAYIQGGGGEGERGTTASDFADSLAPQTLKANAAITTKLLRSKIGSLENQWTTTMKPGTPDQQFQNRFITPDAKATLDKLSPQGGASGPTPQTHTFSLSAWQKANPKGNAFAAKAAAQAQGYTVAP